MAHQHGFGYGPDEYEYSQTAFLNDQPRPGRPDPQLESPYQGYVQQGMYAMYNNTNKWHPAMSELGGTAQAYNNTTAMAYQQATHNQDPFTFKHFPSLEVACDGALDQDMSGGDPTWPFERQPYEDHSRNPGNMPGWQPLMSQASRSMESPNLGQAIHTSYYDGGSQSQPLCEQSAEYSGRDDDTMSEASIDLEENLAERQTARRDVEPSALYGYHLDTGESQPWTSLTALGGYEQPRLYSDMSRFSNRIEVLSSGDVTDTSQDSASSYVIVNRASSASSLPDSEDLNMADSAATLRQLDPWLTKCPELSVCADIHEQQSMLTQQDDSRNRPVLNSAHLNTIPFAPNHDLLLPPASPSGHSVTTSTTSRRSIPAIIHCKEPGCVAQFKGRYRQGNYARHRRNLHRELVVIACESPHCDRSFKRTDARLKHYRKHHPELASELVLRPGRTEQDFTLSRVGSGLE